LGGVSTHLDRLVPLLERAGLTVGVLNHFASIDRPFVLGTLRRNPLRYLLLPRRFRARIVHYHHTRLPHLFAVALGRRGQSAHYVVTLHGRGILKYLPADTSRPRLLARSTQWALGRFDLLIAVNGEVGARLREHLRGKRIVVVPAFVEPEQTNDDTAAYDQALEKFLGSGTTLVAAAYGVQFLEGGRELYGLDLAVDVFVELAAERSDLRLVLFIARPPKRSAARRHLAKLEETVLGAGLADRFSIVFGQPLVPALRANTVFLRPSRADGDALSVREARQAGVPVVASDVVERPEGIVVFPTGDRNAFAAAVRAALKRVSPRTNPAVDGKGGAEAVDSFSDRLIQLYRVELRAQAKVGAEAG
jgi:glycosyltransferase involved in cell wall biosynthesis